MSEFKSPSKDFQDDYEDYKKACGDVSHHITNKGAHTFICMIDGSEQAHIALEAALLLRRKYDHISILHAYKGNLLDTYPANFKPEQVLAMYEAELTAKLPAGRFNLYAEDRAGRPVLTVLKQAISPYRNHPEPLLPSGKQADFIVFGSHGNKGKKASPTTLGSVSQLALRSLIHPCIIIKKPLASGPRTYLMAVNLTEVSKVGLDILLELVGTRDKVICFTMIFPDAVMADYEATKDYYETELAERGPANSEYRHVQYARGSTIQQAIVKYVDEQRPDFFVIAPRAKKVLSSISDKVVNDVECSVILCQC